jgi:hypothetical protein
MSADRLFTVSGARNVSTRAPSPGRLHQLDNQRTSWLGRNAMHQFDQVGAATLSWQPFKYTCQHQIEHNRRIETDAQLAFANLGSAVLTLLTKRRNARYVRPFHPGCVVELTTLPHLRRGFERQINTSGLIEAARALPDVGLGLLH